MLRDDLPPEFSQPAPKTLNVLALLVCAAAVFSYLGAYAGTNALVAAGLMEKWPADHDPRSRWMVLIFAGVAAFFLLIATYFKYTNWRQKRQMAKLADA